jgi:hypothetical protein
VPYHLKYIDLPDTLVPTLLTFPTQRGKFAVHLSSAVLPIPVQPGQSGKRQAPSLFDLVRASQSNPCRCLSAVRDTDESRVLNIFSTRDYTITRDQFCPAYTR